MPANPLRPMPRRWCPGCDREVPVQHRSAKFGGQLVYRSHYIAPGGLTRCPMSRRPPVTPSRPDAVAAPPLPPPARGHLRLVHSRPEAS